VRRHNRAGRDPHRAGRDPQEGDMVIDALVRARLLGLQLLTLEARVVVGTPDRPRRVVRSPLVYSVADQPDPRAPVLAPGPGEDSFTYAAAAPAAGTARLTRAVQLVEQGADTLERSRRGHAITAARTQS
jgi:hypothetical protein